MAKVLKCDGCGREMGQDENLAGDGVPLLTIKRRLSATEIKVCLSVSIGEDGLPGEVCLSCVKRIVKEHKENVVKEVALDRPVKPLPMPSVSFSPGGY